MRIGGASFNVVWKSVLISQEGVLVGVLCVVLCCVVLVVDMCVDVDIHYRGAVEERYLGTSWGT